MNSYFMYVDFVCVPLSSGGLSEQIGGQSESWTLRHLVLHLHAVEDIEEEVTMVTVVWVEVCTEVGTIEVATEAKVCNEVGEPVILVGTLEDQQATPSNVLSLSRVSLRLCIVYLLASKIFS